jgi:hypothetical protein
LHAILEFLVICTKIASNFDLFKKVKTVNFTASSSTLLQKKFPQITVELIVGVS